MFKKVFIAVGLLIAAFLIFASTRPDTFEVRRTITVNATASEVYRHIHDFQEWQQWSPWEKRDIRMKREFSGPDSGLGAVYAWDGNNKVGAGRMEIVEVSIPYRISIRLDILKPYRARNNIEFLLDPRDGVTNLTWSMTGTYGKMAKLMSVFVDMDDEVGSDFEAALAKLKEISEAGAAP